MKSGVKIFITKNTEPENTKFLYSIHSFIIHLQLINSTFPLGSSCCEYRKHGIPAGAPQKSPSSWVKKTTARRYPPHHLSWRSAVGNLRAVVFLIQLEWDFGWTTDPKPFNICNGCWWMSISGSVDVTSSGSKRPIKITVFVYNFFVSNFQCQEIALKPKSPLITSMF